MNLDEHCLILYEAMKYLITLLLFTGSLLFNGALHAQSYFDDFLKDQGLSFKKPEGYTLKIVGDEDEDEFECHCYNINGRKDLLSGDFYLYNSDKSVIIMIEDDGYSDLKGALVPYWYDDNKMFFNNAVAKADTSKYALRFYSANELRPLNADGAAELTRNCHVPGNNAGHLSNRNIYISKAYQGNFNLIYLFKDTVRSRQDKIISETKNMLTFTKDKKKAFSRAGLSAKYDVSLNIVGDLDTMSTLWNRGSIYNRLFYFNREQYAVRSGDIIISIQFPVNHEWPYFNNQSKALPPIFEYNSDSNGRSDLSISDTEKLLKANNDFKKYLTLTRKAPIALTRAQLETLNADKGYIFDFESSADDLYRDKYRKCKVILLHKNNLGSILLKYYYLSNGQNVDQIISKTLGFVKFSGKDLTASHKTEAFPF